MRRLTLWGCLSLIGCASPAPEVAVRTPPAAAGGNAEAWADARNEVVRYFAKHLK